MSAWSRCGQPRRCTRRASTRCCGGRRASACRPSRAGLRPARCRRTGARRSARAGRPGSWRSPRRSGSPSSRRRGGRPARRPRSAAGPEVGRCAARSSTPSMYSTTTPSTRRSSPHTFSTSSASWRPSTKIRLARATRAVPGTATDPEAVRVRAGPGGSCASRTGRPRGGSRGRAGRSGACLGPRGSRCQVALDRDDLTAPVGGDLLDDEACRRRSRRRGRAWGAQSVLRTSDP